MSLNQNEYTNEDDDGDYYDAEDDDKKQEQSATSLRIEDNGDVNVNGSGGDAWSRKIIEKIQELVLLVHNLLQV